MINTGDVKKIAVIGAGAMGNGIAQVFAVAGYSVCLTDIKQEFLDKAMIKIMKSLDRMISKGKLSGETKERVLSRQIKTSLDIAEAVKGAEIVIEVVPEIMDLKKQVFKNLSGLAGPEVIFATNTSTMSISEIASVVKNPERFAGMHFFNPVSVMKLVEIIHGEKTGDGAINLLCDAAEKCGKVPVKVLKDRPGFIVNRINAPIQALLNAILDEGKIKPAEIDCVMKKVGVKMAPFETADFVGLDVFTHTLSYYSETLSPQYKPGRYLMDKISRNELGMKSRKGIYDWSTGRAVIDTSSECMEISPLHLLSVQINEAVRVYKEGISQSIEDIDKAVKFGMNAFAGPFTLSAGMQPSQISDSLKYLVERFGLTILAPEPEILDGSFKTLGK